MDGVDLLPLGRKRLNAKSRSDSRTGHVCVHDGGALLFADFTDYAHGRIIIIHISFTHVHMTPSSRLRVCVWSFPRIDFAVHVRVCAFPRSCSEMMTAINIACASAPIATSKLQFGNGVYLGVQICQGACPNAHASAIRRSGIVPMLIARFPHSIVCNV